ncbi:MAG TPA: SgcJ/EcaC family oxidoreductase [Pirellulales bacterium]|nr:SgcJ/EcaC family oxidoreductase [Pirellulales bacterium]
MKILFLSLSLLGVLIWTTLAADEPTTDKTPLGATKSSDTAADSRADDEAAIRAAGKTFIDAYNARDAKKLAAQWSPEAIYIDPLTGEQTVGRDEIEKVFADAFSDKQDAKLEVDLGSIEFVSPNVAIVRGVAHVVRPGAEPEDSDFTSVRVKRDGQWLLDRVSEVEKEKTPPSNYEHLKELEWMIGSWHDDDPRPSVEIQTDCAWTKNKNFLTRSYAVAIGDDVRQSGMQIIGWDPVAKQIRSWLFDSNGGFGEGTWKHKENKWFIENTATLPDGGKATSLNIMTKLDDDSFKWESTEREIDGELQPNVDPVVVVRKTDQ